MGDLLGDLLNRIKRVIAGRPRQPSCRVHFCREPIILDTFLVGPFPCKKNKQNNVRQKKTYAIFYICNIGVVNVCYFN